MTHTITIDIPERMYQKAANLAAARHISLEQLVQEQFYATLELYWQERSKTATKEEFDQVLKRVPDVEPEEYDRLH
ncbi:MAG: hypothetical protein MUF71_15590 [Candidatus Kapabacteria bacterium]|jgi:hypothetical protein|nr:hypothetical protein [Candidatus Kapabacteria bacterium]